MLIEMGVGTSSITMLFAVTPSTTPPRPRWAFIRMPRIVPGSPQFDSAELRIHCPRRRICQCQAFVQDILATHQFDQMRTAVRHLGVLFAIRLARGRRILPLRLEHPLPLPPRRALTVDRAAPGDRDV